jgi:tetratricopeptide (TPR) repeat protein
MADALNDFAQQVDRFRAEFEALEAGDPCPQFSARVPYIRGVAAHYANQPEIAKECLEEVVHAQGPEPDETKDDHSRRIANANYYLGLTESNFGNHSYAIQLFEKANELDLEERDFLTRVVTAESYVMLRNFDKAREFTDAVKAGLAEMAKTEGPLLNHQRRLQSRAMLIKANMEIIGREGDWQGQAQQLLERVHAEDPQYYYATATLAQVYYVKGDRDKARELFQEAYTTIQQLGHLITVTEARTRVLLLMTAGMCCKHGPQEERWAEEHLDRATDLLGSLPRRGHQICTVFSTLSKQNESSDVIRHHIELIRKGRVLL